MGINNEYAVTFKDVEIIRKNLPVVYMVNDDSWGTGYATDFEDNIINTYSNLCNHGAFPREWETIYTKDASLGQINDILRYAEGDCATEFLQESINLLCAWRGILTAVYNQ